MKEFNLVKTNGGQDIIVVGDGKLSKLEALRPLVTAIRDWDGYELPSPNMHVIKELVGFIRGARVTFTDNAEPHIEDWEYNHFVPSSLNNPGGDQRLRQHRRNLLAKHHVIRRIMLAELTGFAVGSIIHSKEEWDYVERWLLNTRELSVEEVRKQVLNNAVEANMRASLYVPQKGTPLNNRPELESKLSTMEQASIILVAPDGRVTRINWNSGMEGVTKKLLSLPPNIKVEIEAI